MHHIYHTEAIVLESRDVGEANKRLTLFTREMGMVKGMVQGVRYSKSKLRFALQDFSTAQVDLVRGKDIWRVTSARPMASFAPVALSTLTGALFRRIVKLVLRLYHGEDSHEALFHEIVELFQTLNSDTFLPTEKRDFETVATLRVLYHLGYYAPKIETEQFVRGKISKELLEKAKKSRASIALEINQALSETQL